MFQEFRTHAYYSITVLFPIWVYAYALLFKIKKNSKALLDISVSRQLCKDLISETVS